MGYISANQTKEGYDAICHEFAVAPEFKAVARFFARFRDLTTRVVLKRLGLVWMTI